MKTVFNDISKVAHIWANQSQQTAKNNGNFYFEGPTIYSYGSHFPIAKHVTNNQGEKAILFTERRYSNTTSKHISVTRQACRNDEIISCWNPEASHDQNFNSFRVEIEKIAQHLLNAKKPEKYLLEIDQVKGKAIKYATFFDIAIPNTLQAAFELTSKEKFAEYEAKKEAFKKSAEKKAAADLKKRHKKELAKWLNGETSRLYSHDGYDYLRLNGDRVETSQAVEIPLKTALSIYEKLKNETLKVGDHILNNKDFEGYPVKKINGVVAIGCHTFLKQYMLDFGAKILHAAQ